jgi:hypothetical protein
MKWRGSVSDALRVTLQMEPRIITAEGCCGRSGKLRRGFWGAIRIRPGGTGTASEEGAERQAPPLRMQTAVANEPSRSCRFLQPTSGEAVRAILQQVAVLRRFRARLSVHAGGAGRTNRTNRLPCVIRMAVHCLSVAGQRDVERASAIFRVRKVDFAVYREPSCPSSCPYCRRFPAPPCRCLWSSAQSTYTFLSIRPPRGLLLKFFGLTQDL